MPNENENPETNNSEEESLEPIRELSPLNVVLFDDVTFSDLLKDGVNSIKTVEAEVMEIYRLVKSKIKSSKPEEALLHIDQAQTILELATKQAESRAKLIQAATNAIRGTGQPSVNQQFNIATNGKPLAPAIDFTKLESPLQLSSDKEETDKKENKALTKEELEKDTSLDNIPIIHSPNYKSKK